MKICKARALPEHLPRTLRIIEPNSITCPCGCGDMVRIGEDRTERLDYIPARYRVIVSVRPRYACPKGRTGVVQAKAPAHLLEGSWPTEALLAQIAVSKHSEHLALNRQAVVMARLGVPIDRSVLADRMGRTGALIAPVVDRMAVLLKQGSTRLHFDETTAPVLDPGRGKSKTGYLWAVLRDDRGWNGPAPPGVVFHYRPGRKGEYAAEILDGFNGTIQVDAYGGYTQLATPKRTGGEPLQLAFCWAHGQRKRIAAKPKKGSPIVDEALLRVAALYKVEDARRWSASRLRCLRRSALALARLALGCAGGGCIRSEGALFNRHSFIVSPHPSPASHRLFMVSQTACPGIVVKAASSCPPCKATATAAARDT